MLGRKLGRSKMAAKKKKAAKKKAAPKKKAPAPKKKKVAKKKAAPKKKPAGPSPDNKKAFEPGQLVTHDNGTFSLIYTAFVHGEVFEGKGLEGGVYTWHGLGDHLPKQDSPQSLKALDFDPEGSMFAVVSKDLAALHACAKALGKLQDKSLLEKLASTVDLSEFD